jgi:hypothetical protein
MRKIITHKRHYLTRVPAGILGIVLVSLSPLLIGIAGAWLTEQQTGEPCHEGNCGWMVLPWFVMITVPLGGMAMLGFLLVILRDSIALFNIDSAPKHTTRDDTP